MISHQSSIIRQLSVIIHRPITIVHQSPYTRHHSLSIIRHPSSLIRHTHVITHPPCTRHHSSPTTHRGRVPRVARKPHVHLERTDGDQAVTEGLVRLTLREQHEQPVETLRGGRRWVGWEEVGGVRRRDGEGGWGWGGWGECVLLRMGWEGKERGEESDRFFVRTPAFTYHCQPHSPTYHCHPHSPSTNPHGASC